MTGSSASEPTTAAPTTAVQLYEAHDNGPKCSADTIITDAATCQLAAQGLGYTGTVVSGSWGHAPKGCAVGHPTDNWKDTYFNSYDGQTGRSIYRSICSKPTGG